MQMAPESSECHPFNNRFSNDKFGYDFSLAKMSRQ